MTEHALSQLELVLAALDARDQQRRGVDVVVETDAELRRRVEWAVKMLRGGGV